MPSKPSELQDLRQARVSLIVNQKAGTQGSGHLLQIREHLAPLVGRFSLHVVPAGQDIAGVARRAVRDGSDIVLALGGDGTQSAVASALVGTDTVMGVLPGGTFNYFARELGVEDLETALAAVTSGQVLQRDIGRINQRLFINNASLGLYPHILKRREEIYRKWGRSRIAAYGSVLLALAELADPMHLDVTVDGQCRSFRTPLAFIARSAYQLESLGLEGAEAVRAGRFALYIVKGQTRRALVAATLRLSLGKSAPGEDFELLVADELLINIRTSRKLVALDGEKKRMAGPFRLDILRGGLKVIVPQAQVETTGSPTP